MAPDSLLPFFSALGIGGLTGTLITIAVQGRREKIKTTIALIEGFSTLEAHKLRREFWTSVLDPARPLLSLDAIGAMPDDDRRHAVLYVVGFFTTAGSLMRERLLHDRLFFSLAERWVTEIVERHLYGMSEQTDPAGPYRVHQAAIVTLQARWQALSPSPRRHFRRHVP